MPVCGRGSHVVAGVSVAVGLSPSSPLSLCPKQQQLQMPGTCCRRVTDLISHDHLQGNYLSG